MRDRFYAVANADFFSYRLSYDLSVCPITLNHQSRSTRCRISSAVLVALLWLQGNVLWHDTTHAGHNHSTVEVTSLWQHAAPVESDHATGLLCTLDVLIPDLAAQQPSLICRPPAAAPVQEPGAGLSVGKAALIAAYLSRAPPGKRVAV